MKPSDLIEMGWCRVSRAHNKDGKPCDAVSPYAVAWCPLGAIEVFYGSGTPIFYNAVSRLLGEKEQPRSSEAHLAQAFHVALWADHPARQKEEILAQMRQVGL